MCHPVTLIVLERLQGYKCGTFGGQDWDYGALSAYICSSTDTFTSHHSCLIHCLFHVNILLNHSIKRLQRGRILTSDKNWTFEVLFYLPYWLKHHSPACVSLYWPTVFSLNDTFYVISMLYTKEHWWAVQSLSSFTAFCLQAVIVLICVIEFLITVSNMVNHTEHLLNIKFCKVFAVLQAG